MAKEKPTSPDVARGNYESAERERTEAQLEHYGEIIKVEGMIIS